MQKRAILWPLTFAMLCLSAGAPLSTGDAMDAKRKKGAQGLAGWCWRNAESAKHQEMCFGRIPRLKMIAGNQFEAFESEGLYRTRRMGALQLVGFPGEGWPGRSSLLECQFEISDLNVLQLSGCEVSGRWTRSSKHSD